MAKMTAKDVAKRSIKGWGAVLSGGILLTVLALADGGGTSSTDVRSADSSAGCQMQVTAAQLRVRSGPSVTAEPEETLTQGMIVDATTEVKDGFRRLKGDRWAANDFLVPVTGKTC